MCWAHWGGQNKCSSFFPFFLLLFFFSFPIFICWNHYQKHISSSATNRKYSSLAHFLYITLSQAEGSLSLETFYIWKLLHPCDHSFLTSLSYLFFSGSIVVSSHKLNAAFCSVQDAVFRMCITGWCHDRTVVSGLLSVPFLAFSTIPND